MREIAEKVFKYRDYPSYSQSQKLSARYSPYLNPSFDRKEFVDYNAEEGRKALTSHFSNIESLGPFETMILENILIDQKRLICIVGARGCGKSSTMRYLKSFIAKEALGESSPFVFLFNANFINPDGVPGDDHYEKQIEYIERQLPLRLLDEILEYEDAIVDILDRYITHNGSRPVGHLFAALVDSLRKQKSEQLEGFSFTRHAIPDMLNKYMQQLHRENRVEFCFQLLSHIVDL